jgi:hypothetical protein
MPVVGQEDRQPAGASVMNGTATFLSNTNKKTARLEDGFFYVASGLSPDATITCPAI